MCGKLFRIMKVSENNSFLLLLFTTGVSNQSLSLGRRSAFFPKFGLFSVKNQRRNSQNTVFSLNSKFSLGRTLDTPVLQYKMNKVKLPIIYYCL